MSHKTKGILAHVLAALFWGSAAPVVKLALKEISPFTFVFLRMFLAILILSPFILPRLLRAKIKFSHLPLIILSGLLGITLNIGFYFWGLSYTTVIDSSVIAATTSIFTALAAVIFLSEKVSRIMATGILVSFIGTVVIIVQPIIENGLFQLENIFGNILILLAVLMWVAYTIFNKEVRHKYDSLVIVYLSFMVGAVSFFPLASSDIFNPGFYLNMSQFLFLAIIFETVLATVLAYSLFLWGIKYISAATAGVIAYLHPLVAITISVIFLGEKITLPFILGAGLVALGLFLAETKHPVHPLHHLHKKTKIAS